MRRLAALAVLVALLARTDAALASDVGTTPRGYTIRGDKRIPSTAVVNDLITEARREAGNTGKVSIGSGFRPSISMVRTGGSAGICRTTGIVPPLGVGRYGEPGIGGLPICPAAPGQPAPVQPPPTPLEAAYYAWLFVIDLPSPTGSTQPTVGITGLDTFLTIKGQQGMVVDVPALGFDVHFEITSVYDVDWDDPRPDGSRNGVAVTRNHRTQGGPYPTGDLRHQYIERGTADIVITQRWSATWSAGSEGGSLPDSVETTGSLSLPIQEIQAVVTG
jgi:hypothetical protein